MGDELEPALMLFFLPDNAQGSSETESNSISDSYCTKRRTGAPLSSSSSVPDSPLSRFSNRVPWFKVGPSPRVWAHEDPAPLALPKAKVKGEKCGAEIAEKSLLEMVMAGTLTYEALRELKTDLRTCAQQRERLQKALNEERLRRLKQLHSRRRDQRCLLTRLNIPINGPERRAMGSATTVASCPVACWDDDLRCGYTLYRELQTLLTELSQKKCGENALRDLRQKAEEDRREFEKVFARTDYRFQQLRRMAGQLEWVIARQQQKIQSLEMEIKRTKGQVIADGKPLDQKRREEAEIREEAAVQKWIEEQMYREIDAAKAQSVIRGLRNRVEDLMDRFKKSDAELTHLKATDSKQKEQYKKALEDIADLRQEVKKEKEETQCLRHEAEKKDLTVECLRADSLVVKEECERLSKRVKELDSAAHQHVLDLSKLRTELSAVRQQLATTEAKLEDAHAARTETSNEAVKHKAELEAVRRQLKAAERALEQCHQETLGEHQARIDEKIKWEEKMRSVSKTMRDLEDAAALQEKQRHVDTKVAKQQVRQAQDELEVVKRSLRLQELELLDKTKQIEQYESVKQMRLARRLVLRRVTVFSTQRLPATSRCVLTRKLGVNQPVTLLNRRGLISRQQLGSITLPTLRPAVRSRQLGATYFSLPSKRGRITRTGLFNVTFIQKENDVETPRVQVVLQPPLKSSESVAEPPPNGLSSLQKRILSGAKAVSGDLLKRKPTAAELATIAASGMEQSARGSPMSLSARGTGSSALLDRKESKASSGFL